MVFDIRTPGELAKAIRIVRASIDDGTLTEVDRPDGEPFSTLKEEGPWADVIDCRFSCRHCGALFGLSVETYHGSGGRWSRT